MLTVELAERLAGYANAADPDWQHLLNQAAKRLAVCGGCAYCEHAARATKEQHGP